MGAGSGATGDFAHLAGLTVTRASVGYAQRSDGTLVQFGNNVARITDRGLLVEEARTNNLLWSQDFTNAAWAKSAATVLGNQIAAPDGTVTASKISGDGTSAFHYVSQNGGTAAGHLTAVYFKIGDARYGFVQIRDQASANGATVIADLQAGTISTPSNDGTATGAAATITAAGNGFYRIVLSCTLAASGQSNIRYGITNSATTVNSFSTSTGIYAWQADENTSATFATSPIPTTSASATRSADVISIGGLSQAAAYTVLSEATATPKAATVQIVQFSAGNDNNREGLSVDSSNRGWVFGVSGGNLNYSQTTASLGTSQQTIKLGGSHDGSAYHGAVNGSALTATTAAAPVGMTTLTLGSDVTSAANMLNGYLRKAVIYPRAFTDAELQAASQ